MGDLEPHLIHSSMGPHGSALKGPNGISIDSAVLAELRNVTNRQTDVICRPRYSVWST